MRQPSAFLDVSSDRLGFDAQLCVLLLKLTQTRLVPSAASLSPPSFLSFFLLTSGGTKAFLEHCTKVAVLYEKRRIWFEELAHKHLDGIATWTSPVAGMFLL